MRTALGLLVAIAALPVFAAPAAASDRCPRHTQSPRFEALRSHAFRQHVAVRGPGLVPAAASNVLTSALSVCDHRTGDTRTLRTSSRWIEHLSYGSVVKASGRRIGKVVVAGGRIAWTEETARPTSPATWRRTVWVASLRTGHLLRRRVVQRGRWVLVADDTRNVALTARGDLVWSGDRLGLWLWRVGSRPTRLSRQPAHGFVLLDAGRTLIWNLDDLVDLRAVDIRPVADDHGCPRRPGFTTVASTPELLVSTRTVPAPNASVFSDSWTLWRACSRLTHRDRLVYGGSRSFFDVADAAILGLTGSLMLLEERYGGKGGSWTQLELIDVLRGRHLRVPVDYASVDHDVVLLADGSFAWIGLPEGPNVAVFLQRPNGDRTLLDAVAFPERRYEDQYTFYPTPPPIPPITSLALTGTTLTWLHAGEPRTFDVALA